MSFFQIEQKFSAEQSTLVNRAFRTLQDPLQRAVYLLELRGETIDESDSHSDTDFLMQILQLNEELADIDTAQDFHNFVAKNDATLDEIQSQLTTAFDVDNDVMRAKSLIVKMKYYSNLKEKLKDMGHLYIQ